MKKDLHDSPVFSIKIHIPDVYLIRQVIYLRCMIKQIAKLQFLYDLCGTCKRSIDKRIFYRNIKEHFEVKGEGS